MNYSMKELVRSFDWSDASTDRSAATDEIINGRTYIKTGTMTATSVVGDLYKIDEPSGELLNKYVLLIGVARQHPADVKVDKTRGINIAAIKAKLSPIAQINFPTPIDYDTFAAIAEAYVNSLPIEFVKTKEELKKLGMDPKKYNRGPKTDPLDKYYADYAADCARLFKKA